MKLMNPEHKIIIGLCMAFLGGILSTGGFIMFLRATRNSPPQFTEDIWITPPHLGQLTVRQQSRNGEKPTLTVLIHRESENETDAYPVMTSGFLRDSIIQTVKLRDGENYSIEVRK
jgi:hypothetical protein